MMLAMATSVHWLLLWLALAAALLLAAIYSGLETGIYVTNKVRLDLLAEQGLRRAKLLRRMLEKPSNVLATLLVGFSITAYVATFIISAMFHLAGYTRHVEWYTLAVETPVLFIISESVPKNVAQRLGDKFALALVDVLWVSSAVYNALGVAPAARWLADLVVGLAGRRRGAGAPLGHAGIAAIVAEGQASGVLTHSQSIMADRIMHLRDVKLADVMIRLPKAATLALDASREAMLATLRAQNYSRLPVLDTAGQVAGILDIYDVLLTGQGQPAEKMAKPLVLHQAMRVSDALYQMQKARAMMAVIRNAEGKHVGIVTIKDLVEEIVGELEAW